MPGFVATMHKELMEDDRYRLAKGSSHNHQAWEGGYLEHLQQTLFLAIQLYPMVAKLTYGVPSFSLMDALVVLFLHDIEKPWKHCLLSDSADVELLKEADPSDEDTIGFSKENRRIFRDQMIQQWRLSISKEMEQALRYIEGENEDYSSRERKMNSLGAFCHTCDVMSARIFHDSVLQVFV